MASCKWIDLSKIRIDLIIFFRAVQYQQYFIDKEPNTKRPFNPQVDEKLLNELIISKFTREELIQEIIDDICTKLDQCENMCQVYHLLSETFQIILSNMTDKQKKEVMFDCKAYHRITDPRTKKLN